MDAIADILLAAGALGAGLYCLVLARRLRRFNDLEKGMGGAVAVLSAQVDDLKSALGDAKTAASDTAARLERTTTRAEETARRLELAMGAADDGTGHRPGDAAESGRAVRRRRRREPADASGDAA